MKKILLAFLLLTSPAFAQTTTSGSDPYSGITATIATLNDAVALGVQGSRWATVKLTFSNSPGGSALLAAEQTVDGINWSPGVMGRRLDAVTADPSINFLNGTQPPNGSTWEVALPANAVGYRVRVSSGGTGWIVTVQGGNLYVPGMLVTGVLWDLTSAVNTAIDTGTKDMSGWHYASVEYTTPAGGSGTISRMDDTGTSATILTVPASAFSYATFSDISPVFNVTTVALPAAGYFGTAPISKRMRFQSAGVAAVTSRIRIEVRR